MIILQVHCLVVGNLQENCFILINNNDEALIIDPGDEAKKIIDFLKPYKVVGILVTHYHFDHIGALKDLEKYFSVKANQKINNFDYVTMATPGHTLDSVSFYFPKEKMMFVGDFVFYHTIGRTDLGGDEKLMKDSIINLINTIPMDTILYPGHGIATILENEKMLLEKIIKKEKL